MSTNTFACSIVRCTFSYSSRHRPGHDTCLLQREGKGAKHCGGKSRSFDTTTRGVATRSSWICRSRCTARWRQSAAASAARNGYQRVGKTTTRAYGECACVGHKWIKLPSVDIFSCKLFAAHQSNAFAPYSLFSSLHHTCVQYRNQLSLQQDARLHLQREALQQRQAELRSVDQRIVELQERLQKRKTANILQQTTNLNVNNNNNNGSSNSPVKATPMHVRSASTHVYPVQKNNTKCNIVAVEPYNHTPNSSVDPKHSIIDDLALLKLSHEHNSIHSSAVQNIIDSDKNEMNRHHLLLQAAKEMNGNDMFAMMKQQQQQQQFDEPDDRRNNNNNMSSIPVSIGNSGGQQQQQQAMRNKSTNDEKFNDNNNDNTGSMLQSHHVISSIISSTAAKQQQQQHANDDDNSSYNEPTSGLDHLKKIHSIHHIPSGNLVVPPRKPISKVAPNVNTQLTSNESEKNKPALPPKPLKSNKFTSSSDDAQPSNLPIKAKPLTIKKQPLSEQPRLRNTSNATSASAPLLKPLQQQQQSMLTRKIDPNSPTTGHQFSTTDANEHDTRRHIDDDYNGNSTNNDNFIINKLINSSNHHHNLIEASPTSSDEPDRSAQNDTQQTSSILRENERPLSANNNIVRRTRNLIEEATKTKLARRVSFDPLALLLDASLEGELELVKKTAHQVPNPSASNDEGITALHNAICAGHLEIVK